MPDTTTLPAWCRLDRDLSVIKLQIRDAPDAGDRLAALLGVAPPSPQRFTTADRHLLAAIAPGEWLLTGTVDDGPAMAARINAAMHGETALILDVTDGVIALQLEGAPATACLAAYTALDLRETTMPCGCAVRTRFGDIGVFVARTGDAPHYRLIADQSYAPYLIELIARSDRPPL
ncbi:hypothetical protein K9B35_03495 [Sphingomonas sp. R647]|uniref:sarcosine oxidase subunit gamma n=1 Tax=Sphingomonas sp. R647 TaxID=2875233 RepID=UPI001CD1EEC3|nr:sarcosine oxidase subunit gamma family protein [Sphingomonas sp. R647]MCA1197021.1 hypothetical protein [Sphingomonas sp. R647]